MEGNGYSSLEPVPTAALVHAARPSRSKSQADMKKRGVDVDDHFIAFELAVSKARDQCLRCAAPPSVYETS